MKKQFYLLLSLLLLSPSAFCAAPKIATMDIAKAMASHQGNKNDIAIFEAARKKLAENPRKVAVDAMAKKVQVLRKKMQDTKEGSDERAQILKEGEAAAAGYNDLLEKWTQFNSSKIRMLTENLVDATDQRNDEILKIAREIGESEGFDWVLEAGGKTNSKMPAVLYIRNSTDITAQIIVKLIKIIPLVKENSPAQSE